MTEPRRTAGAEGLIAQRKAEHFELGVGEPVDSAGEPGWRDIRLAHEALPEVDLDEIDLSVELLGRHLASPLVVAGMTGGHDRAREINATLGRAAERYRLAMGVGSQRAALREPVLAASYAVAREQAPNGFLVANLGAAQLVDQHGDLRIDVTEVQWAVDMIRADALAIHLNFLEESVQPEGDRRTRGCAAAIEALTRALEVPVVAKETGAGMSRETALRLRDVGVAALDVGGAGGTNFAIIERLRAERQGDARGARLGEVLRDWGIPTAVSVVGAAAASLPIIATGGVRSGLDAAKALALGATAVGVGQPLLAAAVRGPAAVDEWIEHFLEELRTVLLLTGSRSVGMLRARPLVVLGTTRRWLDDLGYELPGLR